MSRQREIVKNTAIIAFGKLSTQFLTFLLLPVYTTYLSTDEFGAFDLVITYAMLLAPALTLQLEMASFRFLVDTRNDDDKKTSVISTVLSMVVPIVAGITGIGILLMLFTDITYLGYGLGAIIVMILSHLQLQMARGVGSNLNFSIGSIVSGVTIFVLNMVFVVMLGYGIEGVFSAVIIGNLMCAIYLFFALKLYRYIRFDAVSSSIRKELLAYSVPLVPNGVSWWLINAADRTIITIVLGAATNGVYAVAYRFPQIFNGLFSFFGMSWTESASLHINSPDRDKFFSQVINASIRFFGSLGALMIAAIPIVFDWIIGPDFRAAYTYIPILVVGAFFNSIVGLYSAIYVAKKMTKQVMTTSMFAAAISISASLIGISYIGLFAPSFALAIAFLSMAVYRHYDVKKFVSIHYDTPTILSIICLYSFTSALYYLNTPIGNIVSLAVTSLAVFLLAKPALSIVGGKIKQRGSRKTHQIKTTARSRRTTKRQSKRSKR
ncbi:hypothetical protein CR983_00060 [Candidatus Saccharibacteria bacterium]|nr:MAG: hypothetical protein CR983_00060 [Candidatus Saccharibacteria bacterium]